MYLQVSLTVQVREVCICERSTDILSSSHREHTLAGTCGRSLWRGGAETLFRRVLPVLCCAVLW